MRITLTEIEKCEGFWSCVSPDAWVAGIGTFLGAIIGIAGAYFIFRVEFSKQQKEKKTTFKFEYRKAKRWLILTIQTLKEFESNIHLEKTTNIKLDINERLFDRTKESLDDIQTSIIPKELVDDFELLLYELSGIGYYITVFKENIFMDGYINKHETTQEFHKSITTIEEINNRVTDFLDKK